MSIKTVPGKGFIFEALPRSTKEAASKFSLKRIKTIAKTALQNYVDTFLNSEQHVNRKMLEASSGRIQYFSDLSFSTDPTNPRIERPIQLARMYNNLKENFPCILIIDSGVTPRQYISSRVPNVCDGNFETQLEYAVPVTVAIASLDEETTDILSSLLSLVFGPLLLLAGGVELHGNIDNNDRWTVKLPNNYAWGALTQANVEGDNKDQIWSCTFDLELSFEDVLELAVQDFVEADLRLKAEVGGKLSSTKPTIIFPDTLNINCQETIQVTDFQVDHRIILDSPFKATFDPETFLLTPKFPGLLKIMVLDTLNNIIIQKEVEITL